MIEEIGIVTKADGIVANVIVQRRSACDGCKVQGACKPSDEGMEIEALNPVQAKEGQKVKISIKPQAYLKGTIVIYGIPLLAFMAGVILGKNIGESYFKQMDSDIVSFISGFAALIISFLVVKAWSKKAETKTEFTPVIEEILE